MLRIVGAILFGALSGTLLLLIRNRGVTGRWFEDQNVMNLTPVSGKWLAHDTHTRGQRGE